MVVLMCSCYCAGLCALLRHASEIEEDTGISMLVCFDHEEIGSDSAQGELIVPALAFSMMAQQFWLWTPGK
jgi:hypothetical protein